MQTDLYLIRHGETATNRARLIQGWNNEPLNARGRWQAARTAERLAGLGIQALYASPLSRAHETALFIARACELDVVLVDALREMDTGSVSGLHGAQFTLRHPRPQLLALNDTGHLRELAAPSSQAGPERTNTSGG